MGFNHSILLIERPVDQFAQFAKPTSNSGPLQSNENEAADFSAEMTTLNRYRDYIDPTSKEGIAMLNAAIYDFKSPLEPSERISFESNKDGLRFRETIKRLANQFGYDYIMKNVHTERSSTLFSGTFICRMPTIFPFVCA